MYYTILYYTTLLYRIILYYTMLYRPIPYIIPQAWETGLEDLVIAERYRPKQYKR